MRLLYLFIALAALVLIPFGIWGENFTEMFSQEGTVSWLQQYGSWAWVPGMLLLIADLFLPLPATVIMSALGYVYGPLWGGLLSVLGSFLSGLVAYGLCRQIGDNMALRILGKKDYEKGKQLAERIGVWVVILSRWLPVFPEVIACMAGLVRMPFPKFVVALACGSIPLGFAFAYVGHVGNANPGLAVALSALAPPVLWLLVRPWFKRQLSRDN